MTGFDDDLKRHLTDGERSAGPPPFDDVLGRVTRRRRRRRLGVVAASTAAAVVVGGVVWSGLDRDRDTVVDPGPVASPTVGVGTPTVVDPVATLQDVLPRDPGRFRWGDDIFHLLAGDGTVTGADPWSACMFTQEGDGPSSGGCWDGAPHLGGPLPDVGSPHTLWFAFDYPGWSFDVTFSDGTDCGRRTTVEAVRVTDRVFRVEPAGPAGRAQVDIGGRGPEGDAVTSVIWTTPVSGASPEPSARLSLFTEESGEGSAAYGGPDVWIEGLASTPEVATGTLTVTDGTRTSSTLALRRHRSTCPDDGTLSLSGPKPGPGVLDGPWSFPVTYTLVLTLDGTEYVGTARWPAEQTDEAPHTGLTFEPALPARSE